MNVLAAEEATRKHIPERNPEISPFTDTLPDFLLGTREVRTHRVEATKGRSNLMA